MEKAYSRIKWENYPSIATPLNETNLNKMDISLDEVDNRVLGLDTAKLDKAVANTMVKDIAFNEKTGIFTITLLDGTTKTIDTKLEKVATNFSYNYETQKLSLTLADGTKQEIDMSTLISQYEFADTSTIGFTVGNEGKITAIVKDGSVTEAKLQPNFLANVKTEVSKAKSYADSSYENATTSRNAVTEAKQYRDEALQFRNEAESFAPEGYAELKEQVNENTVKVDTIIEKADLGIKETATGEEIHLTDSAEGKAVEFALYGKAKQNTTQGNQLFDKDTVVSGILTESGEVIPNDSWVTSDYILANPLIEYTVSQKNKVYFQYRYSFYNSNKEFINMIGFQKNSTRTHTFTTPENTSYIRIGYSIKISGEEADREDVMMNIGNTDLPFEPFTNGASPNPQYPQPIEVSGESGSVAVKSCGKNFIDFAPNSQFDSLGITFSKSDDGFGTKIVGTSTTQWAQNKPSNYKTFRLKAGNYKLCKYVKGITNGNKVYGVLRYDGINQVTTSSGNKNFTLSEDKDVSLLSVIAESNATVDCVLYLMVCREEDSDEYEPYKETLSTIPTENGLAGIKVSANGNYTDSNGQQWICDEIVKYADGSGEKIQRVGQSKLADLTWIYEPAGKSRFISKDLIGIIEEPNASDYPNALCESYRVLRYAESFEKYTDKTMCIIFKTSGMHGQLWVVDNSFDNVEDFKNSLGDTLFYYQLAEPITTPLTAEELAEIEKLHTFYPVTNISNDFDCGMSVTYYCDSKNYIDNKIALLTTAMVNSI